MHTPRAIEKRPRLRELWRSDDDAVEQDTLRDLALLRDVAVAKLEYEDERGFVFIFIGTTCTVFSTQDNLVVDELDLSDIDGHSFRYDRRMRYVSLGRRVVIVHPDCRPLQLDASADLRSWTASPLSVTRVPIRGLLYTLRRNSDVNGSLDVNISGVENPAQVVIQQEQLTGTLAELQFTNLGIFPFGQEPPNSSRPSNRNYGWWERQEGLNIDSGNLTLHLRLIDLDTSAQTSAVNTINTLRARLRNLIVTHRSAFNNSLTRIDNSRPEGFSGGQAAVGHASATRVLDALQEAVGFTDGISATVDGGTVNPENVSLIRSRTISAGNHAANLLSILQNNVSLYGSQTTPSTPGTSIVYPDYWHEVQNFNSWYGTLQLGEFTEYDPFGNFQSFVRDVWATFTGSNLLWDAIKASVPNNLWAEGDLTFNDPSSVRRHHTPRKENSLRNTVRRSSA